MEGKKYLPSPVTVKKKKLRHDRHIAPENDPSPVESKVTRTNPEIEINQQIAERNPNQSSDSALSSASTPPAVLLSMKDHLRNMIEMMGEATEDHINENAARDGDTSDMFSNALEEASTILSSAVSSMVEVTVGNSEVRLAHGMARVDMAQMKQASGEEEKCTCVLDKTCQNTEVSACDNGEQMLQTQSDKQEEKCTCQLTSVGDAEIHMAHVRAQIKHEAKCMCNSHKIKDFTGQTAEEKGTVTAEALCECSEGHRVCTRGHTKRICTCKMHCHTRVVPCPARSMETAPICHCNQHTPSPRHYINCPHYQYIDGRYNRMHMQQMPYPQTYPIMNTQQKSVGYKRKRKLPFRLCGFFSRYSKTRKKQKTKNYRYQPNVSLNMLQQDMNPYSGPCHNVVEGIPRVQKCPNAQETPSQGIYVRNTGNQTLESTPERVDVYYFDHGNSGYYRTTDQPPITLLDVYMETSDEYANQFWADIFGTLHIVITFITHFVLQLLRFLLYSIIRPLTVGITQLWSDYYFKPCLSSLFNGVIQPVLILFYNVATSFRDMCEPVAQAFGYFLREVAVVFRATRLVEIQNIKEGKCV